MNRSSFRTDVNVTERARHQPQAWLYCPLDSEWVLMKWQRVSNWGHKLISRQWDVTGRLFVCFSNWNFTQQQLHGRRLTPHVTWRFDLIRRRRQPPELLRYDSLLCGVWQRATLIAGVMGRQAYWPAVGQEHTNHCRPASYWPHCPWGERFISRATSDGGEGGEGGAPTAAGMLLGCQPGVKITAAVNLKGRTSIWRRSFFFPCSFFFYNPLKSERRKWPLPPPFELRRSSSQWQAFDKINT